MPGPEMPHAPEVSISLNFDLIAVETPVAEHDAFPRFLNTQLLEIMSGMETLVDVMERLGVKIQECEDECATDGEKGPKNPTPRQSTTPTPNPSTPPTPSSPSPELRPGFWWERAFLLLIAHMGDPKPTPGADTQLYALFDILRSYTTPSSVIQRGGRLRCCTKPGALRLMYRV